MVYNTEMFRKGNARAKVPLAEKTYQGVISLLKDNFGFIERSDVVKEIFFHYTQYDGNIFELSVGDNVEYNIQIRNGKEVACNVYRLPEGTVVFEDVNDKPLRGEISKVTKPSKKSGDPSGGYILYETLDGPEEIPYGDRNMLAEFTTFPGDIVQFNIATDRRDRTQRATNIKVLIDESILASKEKRDRGVVISLKESYGFLQMLGTGEQLFFHFSELMDLGGARVTVRDELEFTVAHDPANDLKTNAIRVQRIPRAVSDLQPNVSEQTFLGVVAAAGTANGDQASSVVSPKPTADSSGFVVRYTYNDKEISIPLVMKANEFKVGDKVFFNVSEQKSDGSCRAVNLKSASGVEMCVGYVIILKENYGFIETLALDDEIFFHFTHYQGDYDDIEIGTAVEYVLTSRNKKVCAENVRKLRNVSVMEIQEGPPMVGKVVRTVRTWKSSREHSSGLIQVEAAGQGEPAVTYPFGIMSLQNKGSIPAIGDTVQFQPAKLTATGDLRAASVQQLKTFLNTTRPERLISRLKQSQQQAEAGPRLIVIRQPQGPDGTCGFHGATARAEQSAMQTQSATQMPPVPADLD